MVFPPIESKGGVLLSPAYYIWQNHHEEIAQESCDTASLNKLVDEKLLMMREGSVDEDSISHNKLAVDSLAQRVNEQEYYSPFNGSFGLRTNQKRERFLYDSEYFKENVNHNGKADPIRDDKVKVNDYLRDSGLPPKNPLLKEPSLANSFQFGGGSTDTTEQGLIMLQRSRKRCLEFLQRGDDQDEPYRQEGSRRASNRQDSSPYSPKKEFKNFSKNSEELEIIDCSLDNIRLENESSNRQGLKLDKQLERREHNSRISGSRNNSRSNIREDRKRKLSQRIAKQMGNSKPHIDTLRDKKRSDLLSESKQEIVGEIDNVKEKISDTYNRLKVIRERRALRNIGNRNGSGNLQF